MNNKNNFRLEKKDFTYRFISSLGSILLHGGDLQHLIWLGLQWTQLNQRPALRSWLQQLFPLRNLETSKLDSNAPESICLLDLEVLEMMCGLTQLVKAPYINFANISFGLKDILYFFPPKINASLVSFLFQPRFSYMEWCFVAIVNFRSL